MFFIIKLHPEIIVKSRSVRWRWIKRLNQNILKVLRDVDEDVTARYFWDKIELNCSAKKYDSCKKRLQDIPGINSILEAESFNLPLDDGIAFICEKAVKYYAEKIKNRSFVVRVKRVGSHDFSSVDAEREVGHALLEAQPSARVNLKNAEVILRFEIIQDVLHLIHSKVPGMGGFPLGSQDPVLSLISGGFDSPVAAQACLNRGSIVHFLFFNFGGNAHKVGVQQVAFYLWQRYASSHQAFFYTVDLGGLLAQLAKREDQSANGVILKRAMLKIAFALSSKLKIKAVVTGESVAQVSSQTLSNLATIDKAFAGLVLRPLIVSDKSTIIEQAEKIGTAVFARSMPEYCGAISSKPSVSVSIKQATKLEFLLEDQWFDEALESLERVRVSDIIEQVNAQPPIEVIDSPDGVEIIDIRVIKQPIKAATHHIPFYDLNSLFKKLDQGKRYALYCEKGVMSQLHAAYLKERGMQNVCVYRPK